MKSKKILIRGLVMLLCAALLSGMIPVSADANTDGITPVALIDKNNVRFVASSGFGGWTSTSYITQNSYNSATGITTLNVTESFDITSADGANMLVYCNDQNAKAAPYIVLGMSYSAGKQVSISVQLKDGDNSNSGRPWAMKKTLPVTMDKVIIDMNEFTSGQSGRLYKDVTDTECYDYIRIQCGYSEGETVPAGTNARVRYVAFFDTKEAAEGYVYPVGTATVTYTVDGVQFGDTQTYDIGETLVYPEAAPSKDGVTFSGWDVAEGTVITGDLTVNAQFGEAADHYVFSSGSFASYEGKGGLAATKKDMSVNDTSYIRYSVSADATSGDATRAWIRFDTENDFPSDFTLLDYKYVKIGYRSNIQSYSKLAMNIVPRYGRLWGPSAASTNDGTWQSVIYDLSTSLSGGSATDGENTFTHETYASISALKNAEGAEGVFKYCCDGPMYALFLKPYSDSGVAMKTGEYLDVQYVGFFKTKDDADNYTYTESVKVDALFVGENLTGSSEGGVTYEFVEATDSAPSYIHFTPGTASEYEAAGKSDSIRGWIDMNDSAYPADFDLAESKYVKIGYRTNANKAAPGIDAMLANGARMWMDSGTLSSVSDGIWNSAVIDLSNVTWTGGYGEPYDKTVYTTNELRWEFVNDSFISKFLIRPFDTVDYENADAYYDVLYVAFFSDKASAQAYTYIYNAQEEAKVEFDKNVYRMTVGGSYQLGVETTLGASLSYKSNNSCVSVNSSGTVHAVRAGEAEITVTAALFGNTGTDTMKIIVTEGDAETVTVSKTSEYENVCYKPIFTFLGGSEAAGDTSYPASLAGKLHITVKNLASEGTVADIAGKVESIGTDSDIIFVHFGADDSAADTSESDFESGVCALIESLITSYADKHIVFATPIGLEKYSGIITNACKEYGISAIDLNSELDSAADADDIADFIMGALADAGIIKYGESHNYEKTITTPATTFESGEAKYTCTVCSDNYSEEIPATNSIKILAIGNSFSDDATKYLWNVCKSAGIENVTIANLYIGGCSLTTHWNNISNTSAAYDYYKNENGGWVIAEDVTLQSAFFEEDWDYFTVQQSSNDSGKADTYTNLQNIVDYIEENKTNPYAKIFWHMTWAYQSDSTHWAFPDYGSDQMTMYKAIIDAVKTKVITVNGIDGVIPNGTAIQNLRTSYVGDTVTRDGYHLNSDHGRYTAALTYFSAITGKAPENVSYTNSAAVAADIEPIRDAVESAIAAPYAVTESDYAYKTLTVNAVGNGSVTVGETTGKTYSGSFVGSQTVTLTAVPDATYQVDGWYDVTDGKNVLLAKETDTYELTVSDDAVIEVRFMSETIKVATKLSVSVGAGEGTIEVGGNAYEDYTDYANGGDTVEVTAKPNDGYAVAYWTRVSGGVETYIGTNETISVSPLGTSVIYKPVFIEAGTTLNLYVDAKGVIIATGDEPAVPERIGYTGGKWLLDEESASVNVYVADYVKSDETYTLTVNYADGTSEEKSFKYNQLITLTATAEDTQWVLNGTVVSNASEYSFYITFIEDVVIEEVAGSEAEAVLAVTNTVYDAGSKKIKFMVSFELVEGMEFVETGVLLSNNADIADTMEIGDEGVITGKSSAANASSGNFIINKGGVSVGDTWYGRAYLICKQDGETTVLYADTVSHTAE